MPTVEEIERLTSLLGRLGPLGDAQHGELIRAEDWNAVVAALIEVAQGLIEERERPVPPHDHPDQVALGWLDPRLRGLIEGGPLADPASVARVDALEREAERLEAALERLGEEVGQLRERGREIATRDLQREASVNSVRRKVEGIADGRDDVLDVRASLDAVRDRVERAVQLAEDLQADGEPVDLGAVQERVKVLEELRDRLELPDGETLDGAAFERRLAELRNELVTQETLDEAIADHRAELDPEQERALEDRLETTVDTRLEAGAKTLRTELEARTDERLAGVEQLVQRAVGDATPSLTDAILSQAGTATEQRVAAALEQAAADARGQVVASATALRTELASQVDGLRGELDARIDARVDQLLPGRLAGVEAGVGALRDDLGALSGRLERLDGRVDGVYARTTRLTRSTTEALNNLRAVLDARLSDLQANVADRLGELETRMTATIDERVRTLDAGIEARVTELVADRDAALREDLAAIASDQVAGLEDRLPGLVSSSLETTSEESVRRIAVRVVDERLSPR